MKTRSSTVVRLLTLLVIVAPLAVFLAAVPGCNAVHGVGKDISNASTDVEDGLFGSGKSHTGSTTRKR